MDDEASDKALKIPKFEFNGHSDYGSFAGKYPPLSRHFIPRSAKLKALGGESITFYATWRSLQFDMNCVMARFIRNSSANVSVLPTCTNYEMWKTPERSRQHNLGVDPCPDCDIRFSSSSSMPVLAPASILTRDRWKKRQYQKTVVLVGTPSHITCAILRETASSWICEYFDPAGGKAGTKMVKKIKRWFEDKLSLRFKKRIRFKLVHPRRDFQADPHDVMCQTWIWFWVYFRVVRKRSHKRILNEVSLMILQKKSLHIVNLFGSWLSDLLKLHFFDSATDSQVVVTAEMTP